MHLWSYYYTPPQGQEWNLNAISVQFQWNRLRICESKARALSFFISFRVFSFPPPSVEKPPLLFGAASPAVHFGAAFPAAAWGTRAFFPPSFSKRPPRPSVFGETVIIWRTVLRNHFWGTGFGKPLWGNRFWEAVFGSVERAWSTAPKTSGSKTAVLSTRVKVILKGSETVYDLFNTCL